MTDELFVFLTPGEAPYRQRIEGTGTLLAWVPDTRSAAGLVDELADELATDGPGLVELYRGFDLAAAAAVIEAAAGRVPVGVTGAGTPPRQAPVGRSATIYLAGPGADPARRVVRDHAEGRTTVVGVPDPAAGLRVARELADEGIDLVEICGGTPLTDAAAVAGAIGDRVAVGVVAWPFETIAGAAAYKAQFADQEE